MDESNKAGTGVENRQKITALVLTQNVEDLIGPCLESVRWADEILVVASHSTDRTVEIARRYGARILEHPYKNYIAQNNWAIPQATHPWIISVDSDEQVTPELRDEALRILTEGPRFNSYIVRRDNYFMGHRLRYCLRGDHECRLFLRDKARFPDQEVHANPEVEGPSGHLKGALLHFSFRSFEQYIPKFHAMSSRAARDRFRRVRRVGVFHLVLRPLGRFFKQYVLKMGFLDGRAGLVFCGLSAFSSFLKYAKLWEMQERQGAPGTSSVSPNPPSPEKRQG